MIQPGSRLATLLVDFAENYDHIAQVHLVMSAQSTTFLPATKTFQHCFFFAGHDPVWLLQFDWNCHPCCCLAHLEPCNKQKRRCFPFMITDDVKKTNMQVCKFIEDLFFEEDAQLFATTQQHLKHSVLFSNNCGNQFKSRWAQQFALFITSSCQ